MRTDFHSLAAALAATLLIACPAPSPAQTPLEPAGAPRIGALTAIEGRVELTGPAGSGVAPPNWPVASGQWLITNDGGRAEVAIGSLNVRAESATALLFERVDDVAIRLFVERGSIGLTVRNPAHLAQLEVGTPRERIVFEQPGRYRIDVDRLPLATTVTAFAGAARVVGGHLATLLSAGQRGEFRGAPTDSFLLLGAAPDAFDGWALARDAAIDAAANSAYVAAETTGAPALAAYGGWQVVPDYGSVWFPAAPGWVPYRAGQWVVLRPWGRIWIDTAPWGFVTGAYGRWLFVGGRWGWQPYRPVHRPTYPPPLPPPAWLARPRPPAPPPRQWRHIEFPTAPLAPPSRVTEPRPPPRMPAPPSVPVKAPGHPVERIDRFPLQHAPSPPTAPTPTPGTRNQDIDPKVPHSARPPRIQRPTLQRSEDPRQDAGPRRPGGGAIP